MNAMDTEQAGIVEAETEANEPQLPRAYVPLHVHTQFSLLEAASRTKDLVKIAKDNNMPAMAITDSGNVYGAVEFYSSCKAEGIKPDAFEGRGLLIRKKRDNTFENIAFPVSSVSRGGWNIPLQPNDSIVIQSIFDLRDQYTISVQGEVRNPGKIDYIDSLTVEDVIFMSGGFEESAAKSTVEVSRRLQEAEENMASEIFNFPIDENLRLSSNASKFYLRPFDLVMVRKSPFYQNQN